MTQKALPPTFFRLVDFLLIVRRFALLFSTATLLASLLLSLSLFCLEREPRLVPLHLRPAEQRRVTGEEPREKKASTRKQQSVVKSIEFSGAVFFSCFSAFFSDSFPGFASAVRASWSDDQALQRQGEEARKKERERESEREINAANDQCPRSRFSFSNLATTSGDLFPTRGKNNKKTGKAKGRRRVRRCRRGQEAVSWGASAAERSGKGGKKQEETERER